jgi:glycosyltransferase involved in cell wall biosynthesis
MKLRVGLLMNIPSPYQVELFDAIARRGRIDLRVWYCADRDTRRLWDRQRPAHWHWIGSGWRVRTRRELWYCDPRPAIEWLRWKPDLGVVSVYPMPTAQVGMWCASVARMPWVYWGEAVETGGNGLFRRAARRLALFPVRRWATGFFGVGQKGVDNFRRLLRSDDRPVLRMPYFSALARFGRDRIAPREARPITFLYIGSFIHRKGVDLLARAFSHVVGRVPNTRMIIAGDGDTGEFFDAHLSAAAAARVVRRGFVSWQDLPDLYHEADFFVMPTRYDGWGLVIVEAMASGLPVIGSTGAGATLDLVRDGATGWQVAPNDPDQLAAAMVSAATLPEDQVQDMRRKCVLRARRYDAAVGARVFERAVHLILKDRRARHGCVIK